MSHRHQHLFDQFAEQIRQRGTQDIKATCVCVPYDSDEELESKLIRNAAPLSTEAKRVVVYRLPSSIGERMIEAEL